MSFWSITMASEGGGGALPPPAAGPTRLRGVVTLVLMGVWILLMLFAIISVINPPWLKALSSRGAKVEFQDYKHYGDDAMRQERFRLAVPQYEKALEIMPREPGALLNLGIAWIQLGNDLQGQAYLNEALDAARSDRTRAPAYEHLADLAEKRGDRAGAIALMRQAAACETGNPGPYHLGLGQLLIAEGRFGEAAAALETALAAELAPSRSYREMLLRRRDQLQEEGGSLDAIDALLAKGWGPAAAERFDLQILRRAQATDRRVAVVHNHLGWALIQLERFADAAGHFRESLKIWPGNPNAANNLRVLDRMVADRRAQDAPGATP